jgi:hypothetical protein
MKLIQCHTHICSPLIFLSERGNGNGKGSSSSAFLTRQLVHRQHSNDSIVEEPKGWCMSMTHFLGFYGAGFYFLMNT